MTSPVSPCPKAIKLEYFHHFPRAAQPCSSLQSYAVTTKHWLQVPLYTAVSESSSPAECDGAGQNCRAVPLLPQLWEQAKMFIKTLAWAGNLNPALSEHYLMASVGTEDTQSSLEPLTWQRSNLVFFRCALRKRYENVSEDYFVHSKTPSEHLPESVCNKWSRHSTDQSSKETGKYQGNSLQTVFPFLMWKEEFLFWNSYKFTPQHNLLLPTESKITSGFKLIC